MSNAHNSGTAADGGSWNNRQLAVTIWYAAVLLGLALASVSARTLAYVFESGLPAVQLFVEYMVPNFIVFVALMSFDWPVVKIEQLLNDMIPNGFASSIRYSVGADLKNTLYITARYGILAAVGYAGITVFITYVGIFARLQEAGYPLSGQEMRTLTAINTFAVGTILLIMACTALVWWLNRHIPGSGIGYSWESDSA